jgi:hypothetical protein
MAENMKIGIIYCAYNCLPYTKDSLKTFIEAKQQNLISEISSVSIPFEEYFDLNKNEDETTNYLINLNKEKLIDDVFHEPKYIKEHKARDLCLQYLKNKNCDIIWMVDADEFYSLEDIQNIINFINNNANYYWYSINFKNYIFDGKQWIDDFCPPRIFRNKSDIIQIDQFYWDNDIVYKSLNNNQLINYKSLNNLIIPKEICHIKHLTWLHENGKSKYEYQMKHFGHCGYLWNYEKEKLELNQEFYKITNTKIPKIYDIL